MHKELSDDISRGVTDHAVLTDEEKLSIIDFINELSDTSKYIDSCGTMNMVAILTEMEALKEKELLKEHKYTITQLPDGRWQTFLPDEAAKGNRKLVRRVKREDVEAVVIAFYKEKKETFSLGDVAYMWLERKRQEPGFKASSYDRYENHYKRLFSDISSADIRSISEVKLEDYLIKRICEEKISLRVWHDLKTVIRGIFKYAKRHGYTDISIESVFESIDEEKKLFAKPKARKKSKEVFADAEVESIEEYIETRDQVSLVDLGIMLAFRTGLRAGELAAIKYSDLDKKHKRMLIARTEQHSKNEKGHIEYYFSDEGVLKCDHEPEYLYLTKSALDIIEKIHRMNPENDFMFHTDHFIRSQAFTKRLNAICRIIGIEPRPLHKARKTYATRLINANVDDSLVQSQMRHADISTTRRLYYFDNRTAGEKSQAIERAIGQY